MSLLAPFTHLLTQQFFVQVYFTFTTKDPDEHFEILSVKDMG